MVNSNYFNNFGNRRGDFMTFEQIVTYIITPLIAGLVAILGVIKWVIPRIVDSYLKRQEKLSEVEIEVKKSTQEDKRLALEYSRTEATEAQRMLGEIISDLQKAKEKDDDFLRTTVFSFERRLTAVETKTRLLIDLLTKGLLTVEEAPADDFEAWKKSKVDEKLGGSGNDQA